MPVEVILQMEDRRKESRNPVNEPATVTTLEGTVSSLPARVLDFSRSGLRVRVQSPLWTGMQIKVDMEKAILFGEVRYCRCPPAEAGYDVGVRIDQVISKYVNAANQ